MIQIHYKVELSKVFDLFLFFILVLSHWTSITEIPDSYQKSSKILVSTLKKVSSLYLFFCVGIMNFHSFEFIFWLREDCIGLYVFWVYLYILMFFIQCVCVLIVVVVDENPEVSVLVCKVKDLLYCNVVLLM
ncbi:hypothetical protein ACOSQ3_019543 [Xanthoceras sorbifolium]